MNVQWDDRPYNVAISFENATYHDRISVKLLSHAMLTMMRLVDTVSGPNVVHNDDLPPALRKSVKMIKSPLCVLPATKLYLSSVLCLFLFA